MPIITILFLFVVVFLSGVYVSLIPSSYAGMQDSNPSFCSSSFITEASPCSVGASASPISVYAEVSVDFGFSVIWGFFQ